jgi:hypothetical protein
MLKELPLLCESELKCSMEETRVMGKTGGGKRSEAECVDMEGKSERKMSLRLQPYVLSSGREFKSCPRKNG